MGQTSMGYATDEDVALRAPSDFAVLCPKDQLIASSIDAYFSGADRWTLHCASIDFIAQGVQCGQVVQLVAPQAAFGITGDLLVVNERAAHSIQLRRWGLAPTQGQPPVAAGLTGVEFHIRTLLPQIALASYELNRLYGIDDLVVGRRTADLYDSREVRDIVVLNVLIRLYTALSRAGDGVSDVFAFKSTALKSELQELMARAVVHWRSTVSSSIAPTTRFDTRIER